MKILYITNFFPPESNSGAEVYTLGMAKAMRKLGHDTCVFACGKWSEGKAHLNTIRDEVYQGVRVRRLDLNWRLAEDPFTSLFDNPEAEKALASYISAEQPHLVHITSLYTLSASVIRPLKAVKLPVMMTLLDYWLVCPRISLLRSDGSLCDGHVNSRECLRCMAGKAKIFRWPAKIFPERELLGTLEGLAKFTALTRTRGLVGMVGDYGARRVEMRRAITDIDLFLLPSRFLFPLFANHGFPVEKLKVLEWGIDTSWYRQSTPKSENANLRIGYIGQIAWKKGVHTLVESFNNLDSRATLLIYGDPGKDTHYSKTLAALANQNPRIRFAGGFDHSNLDKIMAEIDVLVVPSLWHETFCITVREALLAGVPVVGAKIGAIPDAIIHGENGLLFEPGDILGLSTYLQQLIDDPEMLRLLRKNTGHIKSIDEEALELEHIYTRQLTGDAQIEDLGAEELERFRAEEN